MQTYISISPLQAEFVQQINDLAPHVPAELLKITRKHLRALLLSQKLFTPMFILKPSKNIDIDIIANISESQNQTPRGRTEAVIAQTQA
jgi:hypothetical protein